MKPSIIIEYCPKCGWLLRSAYMAQELLTTFAAELEQVVLKPAVVSGNFIIYIDNQMLFDRKLAGRFPEITELKRLVRDVAAPGRSLGHSDRGGHAE